ncbi:MAG: hypothetical protein B6D36_01595 [Planctomycetes bacterium UTPLA1]|jgi:hypothetical protein|nr:MAG: hypothetical protein B6D36_01595 [Planctomycetes bacterium UTPLA1]
MQVQTPTDEHLTLTEAANVAPGRPSANCIWRWCRRGVKSRTGERIRLQHVRMGGMIYTTARWLEEFGRTLAEADAKYFDLYQAAAAAASAGSTRRRCNRHTPQQLERRQHLKEVGRRLDEAGIR